MIKTVLSKDDSYEGNGYPKEVLFLTKNNERFLVEYDWRMRGKIKIAVHAKVLQWTAIGWKSIWSGGDQTRCLKNKSMKIIKMFCKDYTYEVANRRLLARKIARA